jgi:hypothetical protein
VRSKPRSKDSTNTGSTTNVICLTWQVFVLTPPFSILKVLRRVTCDPLSMCEF